MATTIGLGVQFTANASGMTKGLSQVDRQLQRLGQQANGLVSQFDAFTSSSSAAAAAQQKFATDLAFLNSAYRTRQVSAEQYVAELKTLTAEANASAAAFAEGARITEQQATAEEKRAARLARLEELLKLGALEQEAYNRATAEASGANAEAAAADEKRAAMLARAAQIIKANLSPQQLYDQEVEELSQHLQAGTLKQDQYNVALQAAAQRFAKAEVAAAKYDSAADAAGSGNTLAFNELSGILAALPGPIGNVAGRLSGLASAGEGLGRVFAGGLSQGFGSVASSVAGLVNPMTAGVAAVAAFGAAAVGVANGLVQLEDRVEQLGNLADQLGVSFEFIQTLEEAANRSGVSVETLAGSMTRLQKTLAGADEESKQAQAALGRLGVSIEELNGLSQQDQIRLIGDRLQAIEDPAKRTAAAMALFGKSGAALLPFFNNLGPAANDIERLGGALSEIDRGRIDDFGAGLDALGVASSRLGELLVLPFVGLGEGIAQGTAEFLGGINAIVEPIGNILEPVLSNVGTLFETFGVILGTIGRNIGALLAPFGELAQAVGSVTSTFNDAFVDVVRYLGDASNATTEWLVSFSPIGAIAENIGAIGETISRVATIIGEAFSQVTGYLGEQLASWAEFFGLQSAIETIGGVISQVFGSVSSVFGTIAKAIGGTVGRLLTIAENFLGIKREVETPVEATLDVSQPVLAATQYYDEIDKASKKAAEFGQAGFDAAIAFQNQLEEIAQLQADGTLSADEAKKASENARKEFEANISVIEDESKARQKAAEEAQRAADAKVEADKRVADSALERLRIEEEFGGDSQRAQAAENVLAIQREIFRLEQQQQAAADASDAAEEARLSARLAGLDQVLAREQDIASGAAKSREENQKAIDAANQQLEEAFTFDAFQIAPDAFSAAQQQIDELRQSLDDNIIDGDTFRVAAQAVVDRFEEAKKVAEEIGKLEEKYAEKRAEIDRDRIEELATVSQKALQGNDVRTSEGASQFLALATGREDPAVAEYRKQLKELQDIKREIAKANAQPVQI
jgi:hypothetical protein